VTRLRWRLRGATMWPAFVVATIVEGVLFLKLPIEGEDAGGLVPAVLLAMAVNLVVVAALAPLAGLAWRRRRIDLPRAIATDQAGTILLAVGFAGLLVAGIAHHATVARHDRERADAYAATSLYVHNQARDHLAALARMDARRIDDGMYRTCIPDRTADRALCLFVDVDQSPPGITRDPDRTPNALYPH
jgi:hypothetical protein